MHLFLRFPNVMLDPVVFATRSEHRGGHVQDYVSRNEKASLGILQKCVTSCLYYCTQKCNTVWHEVSMGKPRTSRIVANWEKHVFCFKNLSSTVNNR